MKAAIRRNYCNPAGLKVETITTPTPKADEMLVKIHSTTVNRTDCGVLTGLPYLFRLFIGPLKPRKIITGTDLAGEVVKVGSSINKFKVGDKVWAFNDEGLSSHAEYICLKEKENVDIMPVEISYDEAAASLEGAHYAINITNKVTLNEGDAVLVNGAAGAIGSSMIQILKSYGVIITAVCETKDIPLIKSLGAHDTIDYTKEQVMSTNKKFDYVFDTIGNYSFGEWKNLLNNSGIFISTELGPNNIFPLLALTTKLFSSKKVIFPLPMNIKRSMKIMKQHISEGKFRAVIDRKYSLDEIGAAFTFVTTGFKTGNVIINMTK